MTFFLLLNKLKVRKVRALFCHGLKNPVQSLIYRKKNYCKLSMPQILCQVKITEHIISLNPRNKGVGYVLLSPLYT